MLERAETYEALVAGFQWPAAGTMNMVLDACDIWAGDAPERTALIDMTGAARLDVSYGALRDLSQRVAAHLNALGVREGDRVGVFLPQSAYCAAAHLGIWRLGAISVPLFTLFREDALRSRVQHSGLRVALTDASGAARLDPLGVQALTQAQLTGSLYYGFAGTGPESPAVLMYTSGTTGAPKGALHAHRLLTGHLPGVEMSHDFLGQPGDVLWTPADWAWIGGLFDVLMPGLAMGVPVVAGPAQKFSSKIFSRLIREAKIRNVFLPPTALRMLRADGVQVQGLRSVASGGEPLGAEMLAWGRAALGVTINEFYGQTECNMVASSCSVLFAPRPGCIGRPAPGFDLAVIDEAGQPTTTEGDIAVRLGSVSMMLQYWNDPEATRAKVRGDWMLTGDRGVMEDGFLRFLGRSDDVITTSGYRVGPAEIEDCLLTHPDVATVGVVGKPDPLRTEIVKAYVVRKPAAGVSVEDLQHWVRDKLAAHCYPREITFVQDLPMTVTGKVIRKDLRARAASEAKAQT